MGFLLKGFGRRLQFMNNDRMDIYPYIPSINNDGSMNTAVTSKPLYENIPCHISLAKVFGDIPMQNDYVNQTRRQVRVFCSADVDVNKGDEIVLRRQSISGEKIYRGRAGIPDFMASHTAFYIEDYTIV